jgi:lipopolysaccharide transport system ATP-binding protein
MSNIAIRVENLGKLYRIGGKQERYYTLRDTIVDAVSAPFRRIRGLLRGESASDLNEEIWALKDVSFEIKHGEVVGIIGRNGAGKSTLLKILSRITEPTTGYADVYGRIGALLEVGTGFHPELTGRENIYLNGAILGMSRAEINRKFDEIVDFAGVERFIDTPVKHYSSGMGLRLGFAVAAHLEPEILVVDEVLAVGDAEFQKKCLGKMQDVASEGRTVLLVSHNLSQLRRLCSQCIWLADGVLKNQSDTHEVISTYESSSLNQLSLNRSANSTNYKAKFISWCVQHNDGDVSHAINGFQSLNIQFVVDVKSPILNGHHGLVLYNSDSLVVWSSSADNLKLDVGIATLTYKFQYFPLVPGLYTWYMTLYEQSDLIDEWYSMPSMLVSTTPTFHPHERLKPVINVPWHLEVSRV